MGHESRIELWSPNLTAVCFAGFGTDRLRCEEAMKTTGKENPNHWATLTSDRAPGADGQNRSCSIKWAAKQENVQPSEMCFFLTSTFIELIRIYTNYVIAQLTAMVTQKTGSQSTTAVRGQRSTRNGEQHHVSSNRTSWELDVRARNTSK